MYNNERSVAEHGLQECTGCGVCVITCPYKAIHLELDADGYYQAIVKADICVQCGKCREVCFKYWDQERMPCSEIKKIYAAFNKNQVVRRESSSGGVGTALAEAAFENGYKVIGASYDYTTNRVRHILIDQNEQAYLIRGSKYLPSYTCDAFQRIIPGEKIMVIGTPCQIGGLRKFFELQGGENYQDIILVDFRCFGHPGYNLLDKYLAYLNECNSSGIAAINMRDKMKGWILWGVKAIFKDGGYHYKNKFEDFFAIGFRSGQALHEVCLGCQYYKNNSFADIRLEDGWSFASNCTKDEAFLGLSQVSIYSQKGQNLFSLTTDKLVFRQEELDVQDRGWTKIEKKPLLTGLLREKNIKLADAIKLHKNSRTSQEKKQFYRNYFGAVVHQYRDMWLVSVSLKIYKLLRKLVNRL